MSQSQTKSISFAKVVVFFAAALGVGIGLCGLDFFLGSKGIRGDSHGYSVGPLDGVSLIVMILSALGLLITTLLWLVVAIVESLTHKGSDPQQLFESTTDQSKKEEQPRKESGNP